VEIVASMPCYLEENVDGQRGSGVHSKSIDVLRRLNDVGYGQIGSGLTLNLVYNPGGAFLPSPQASLEADYRHELWTRYSVVFSNLYTITNMPIGRFGEELRSSGELDRYWGELHSTFNPAGVEDLMCRRLISVGWDGTLYDCDFNQALGISVKAGLPCRIERFDYQALSTRLVATAPHCFGCTAGQGSSCGGALL
jgi:radical SAM/Cys-rich protein